MGKWRRRFVERRLEGLVDEQRPGAPRKIADEQVEQVVVATLEQTPRNATHWSRALMAEQSGLEVDRRADLEGVSAQAPPVGDVQVE